MTEDQTKELLALIKTFETAFQEKLARAIKSLDECQKLYDECVKDQK